MRYRTALPCVLAFVLAACSPPDVPPPAPAATAPPANAQAPAAPSKAEFAEAPEAKAEGAVDCAHVGSLFDMLVAEKAKGMTEAAALDDMRNRGEFVFGGPLVDAVFGDRYGEAGSATARAEMLIACRKVEAGGSAY